MMESLRGCRLVALTGRDLPIYSIDKKKVWAAAPLWAKETMKHVLNDNDQ